jgi:hypothetical protein
MLLSNTVWKAIQHFYIVEGNDLYDAKFEVIAEAIQRRFARENSETRFIKTINKVVMQLAEIITVFALILVAVSQTEAVPTWTWFIMLPEQGCVWS